MNNKTASLGHLAALFTVMIWGTTFISTKVLLRSFAPAEILFLRIAIACVALFVFYPKPLKLPDRKLELLFIAAGACGTTVYSMLENTALTLTSASNVSIIISTAPFFTGLLSRWFLTAEKPRPQFYLGFLAAITGIALISYNGSTALELNPVGDLLAVLGAFIWAVYSILTRKISALGFHTIQTTRRIFCYGLLFMIPVLAFTGSWPDFTQLAAPLNLGNILFLGLGGSALCYFTWGTAVRHLGAVKTSVYAYLIPVVTVTFSVLILKEPLTPALVGGAALIFLGLWLSESKLFRKKQDTAPDSEEAAPEKPLSPSK